MKYLLLSWFLLFSGIILAQPQTKKAIPSDVFLNKKTVNIAPAYFLGTNHYKFHSRTCIDSITIADTNNFKLAKEGENRYAINRDIYPKTLIYPANIYLTIYQQKQKPYKLTVPVNLFPSVKIRFYRHDNNEELTFKENDTVRVDAFYCRATWEYPDYVEDNYYRIQGHFRVTVTSGNKMIESMDGWNDTGDRTRPFFFSHYKDLKEVEVVVSDHIHTLLGQRFVQSPVSPEVSLSPSTPKKVFFKPLP